MAAYWLLEGLYRIGTHTTEAADLALEILTSTDTNSWLNMIKQVPVMRVLNTNRTCLEELIQSTALRFE